MEHDTNKLITNQLKRPIGIKPARDLLGNFLASKRALNLPVFEATYEKRKEYKLCGEFISVYFYMFSVMDFNSFKPTKGYQQICDLSNKQIARHAHVSKITVMRAIEYAIKIDLLSIVHKEERKINVYGIGELLKNNSTKLLEFPSFVNK